MVIALACRRLPESQRNQGIFWGVFGAIGLRVVLIFFALMLLAVPFLKIGGALLLLWIGIQMLQPEAGGDGHKVQASTTLAGAVKTIIVADAVMSLDNVIAIAGAAKGDIGLVIFGLVVSVPIIVWGSKLVMKLMDRFPMIVVAGAALLGWIAGEMAITDVTVKDWVKASLPVLHWVGPALGATIVVAVGKWLGRRALERLEQPVVDLALEDEQPSAAGVQPREPAAAGSGESGTSRRAT